MLSHTSHSSAPRRQTGSTGVVLEVVKEPKAKLLLVDDDPQILTLLLRTLRGSYDVTTATSGQAARNLLEQGQFAALLLDLRLPGVRGCELLMFAREVAPDTTRILVSGDADVAAMTSAINDGKVFRFVAKPFTPAALLVAVSDAVQHHRAIAAERELLQETEAASVGALVDLLAITQPGSMGRPARIKELAESIAHEMGLRDAWILGIAAQLSLIGYIIVPREIFLRAQRGVALSATEEALLHRLMPFVERLVASMPRFEQVRAILRAQYESVSSVDAVTARFGSILRTAMAFEGLEHAGLGPASALERLRRSGEYDEELLDVLGSTCGGVPRPRWSAGRQEHRRTASPVLPPRMPPKAAVESELPTSYGEIESDEGVEIMALADVQQGMRFAADVVSASGVVLIAKGQVVSHNLLDRINSAWSALSPTLFVRMVRNGAASDAPRGFERVV